MSGFYHILMKGISQTVSVHPHSSRDIGDFPSTSPASLSDGPGLMLCLKGLHIF